MCVCLGGGGEWGAQCTVHQGHQMLVACLRPPLGFSTTLKADLNKYFSTHIYKTDSFLGSLRSRLWCSLAVSVSGAVPSPS